jgi:plasmid stabilization system protein ParE
MRVILSQEAIEDLVAIGEHISEFNLGRAASFVAELQIKCFELSSAPFAYERLAHRTNPEIRRRPYGNYLIFYRVTGSRIDVLHILHGAQDYMKILFPDD